ncbi:MFS transporter [Arthrobacter sp. Leaf234]|uniref:peptide MFS transporter n=1 Tax=Arthrobacter sp. Leaf234 TaxID=1736303 RepID=UPI0006FC7106|nr:oligopeptide:H+ symporter [Arthrobacter sp. Leaf234]KQO03094.1 MFS transporter [Arthrobacter sp. Leaf234]
MSTSQRTARTGGSTFLGHPRMLANLFSVELWERFSFYGMQALLLYYMTYTLAEGGLGFDEVTAAGLVGAYGGGVYLSTILGAWLADRVFGSERVLFVSAIIIMGGHIALALLPGVVGLVVGLVLVGVGSGGLKANASSLVGTLYAPGDDRRDAGFSIFYMGINIGALVGPLLTNLAWDAYGFHVGFGLAAVGMAAGLVQYALARKNLPATAHEVENPLPRAEYRRWIIIAAAVLVLLGVVVSTGLLNAENLADVMAFAAIVATVAYFAVILLSRKVTAVERRRVYSFMPLFVASAAFWSLFQQQFTVVALYSESRLDRDLFGWEMPPGMVQSINPVFIIVFAGVFAALWTRLGSRQPSSPVKFSFGLMVMGLAFLAFIPFAGGGPNSTPLLGLAAILLLFTWAELFISPIGLSVTTKLAPEAFRTQMLALFFLSISLGTTVSGILAGFYSEETEVPYFAFSGITAIVLGGALLAGAPAIRKAMSGVR